MATKVNPGEAKTRSSVSNFIAVSLCCSFYILGAWQRSGFGKGDNWQVISQLLPDKTDCIFVTNLNYETHHGGNAVTADGSESASKEFQPCGDKYIDYTLSRSNEGDDISTREYDL